MMSAHVIDANSSNSLSHARSGGARVVRVRRVSALLAVAAWLYTIAVVVILTGRAGSPAGLLFIAAWAAIPLQGIAIVFGAYMLLRRGLLAPQQRKIWGWVLAFVPVHALATIFWNYAPAESSRAVLDPADLLYLGAYWILVAVFVTIFKTAGGSFKHSRVWLDIVTMMSVQLAGVWSFLLSAAAPHDPRLSISPGALVAYSLTLASLPTAAALACLQLPSYRGRYGLFLLIGAAACVIASEISWLVDFDSIGAFYNYSDVLCFACVISAGAAVQFQAPLRSAPANTEKQVFGFLPALAVLLAIALVPELFAVHRWDGWILFGMVAVCIQLLLARQASMRREMRELNHRLATREADARLTELVRRSSDLIIVIDRQFAVSFASSVIEPMLGLPSTTFQGASALGLFGPLHEAAMRRFLETVGRGAEPPASLELHVEHLPARPRDFKIGASDQLRNPLILGIVLTVHDVSEQRALEREVLDIASRERIRLCADLHDGLGQELTGIALLLHAAAAAPNPDAELQRAQLDSIVAHVNRAIGAARDLARGYSPLHVVSGSLGAALRGLTHDATGSLPIRLHLDSTFDDRLIGDFAADHLYRIALEAISNAQRHSGAHFIDIGMRPRGGVLALRIADDGTGMPSSAADQGGLGLRLMNYRARLIGASLARTTPSGGGTCIEVTLPLHQSLA